MITFPGGEKKLELRSHVETPPPGPGPHPTQGLLNRFYAEIIGAIRDAETILIFGDGEARIELRQHLERARLGHKIIGVEAAERMTVPQLAAKVREQVPSVPSQGTPASTRKPETPARSTAGSAHSTYSHQEQRS